MDHSIVKQLNNKGNKRGLHPNSLRNLENGRRPWHNPKGRPPKDYCITSIIKEMLDKEADERWLDVGDKGRGLTWRQMIAKAILVGAVKGNPQMIKELLDRIEGKVTLPIEASGTVEIKEARELTDEQLAVIAATNIIKNSASRRSRGTSKET